MDESDLIELQNQPTILQLERLLFKPIQSSLQEFKVINLIIVNVLEIFDELPKSLQKRLVNLFTSLNGINSLINQLHQCASQTSSKVTVYADFMTKVLEQDNIIYTLISKESSNIKLNEIKTIFFGSKVLNIYSRLYVELGVQSRFSTRLNYMEKLQSEYFFLLKKNFADLNYLSTSLVAFLRLSDDDSFLIMGGILSENLTHRLHLIYANARSNRTPILLAVIKYLNYATKKDFNSHELVAFMSSFDLDFRTMSSATSYGNVALLQVLVPSMKQSKLFEFFMEGLQIWGDLGYINRTPLSLQESYTDLLVILVRSLDVNSLSRISQDREFLDAITNRIASTSDRIRSLGMLIGNFVFQSMGKDLIFKIDEELAFENEYLKKFVDHQEQPGTIVEDLGNVNNIFDRLVVVDSDDSLDDASDSDDDLATLDRSKPNKPLFLKELVGYLNADSKKDKHAFDKRKLALVHGPKLILRSAVKNLRFYNDSLISTLIGLTNEYEDADFDDLRLKCLISCCVRDYHEAPTIVLRNFIGGDYSLQQRMCLLSTLSLSVRYLRGHSDVGFNVDESLILFKSKMLPPDIHNQFMKANGVNVNGSLSELTNVIETSLESEIVNETLIKNKKELMGNGTVLRISSKLTDQKERSSTLVRANIPDFYKVVGPQFFFPLVSVWYTLNQEGAFRIGKFSAILAAHFLKTIGLILHTSFPSSNDLQDIVKGSLDIVISVSADMFRIREGDENNEDVLILDSLMFIILVILDSSSNQFLVNFYLKELIVVRSFVSGLLSEEMDALSMSDTLLQKCYTVTYRLNEMFESCERLLVGMEGLY